MTEIILTSSFLILFLIIIRKLLRGRIHPTLQYALWLLVAARLLIPGTLFTAPVSLLGSTQPLLTAIEDTLLPEDTLPPAYDTYTPPEAIPPSAVTDYGDTIITHYPPQAAAPVITKRVNWPAEIWKCGVLVTSSVLLLSNLSFYVNLHKRRRLIDPHDLPCSCCTKVYQVETLNSPCLFGLLHPAIYLSEIPLNNEELAHILVHEETHYRHGDHLWAILRCACLALHWYNPLVWYATVLSRRDCELSCDARAIRRLGEENRIRYGETLLRMVVPGRHPAALLRTATTMSDGKRTMTERITLIARRPRMLKITLAAVVLMACGAAVFFFGGAAEEPAEPSNDDQITADSPINGENATDTDTSTGTLDQITAHEIYVRARYFWNWFEFGTFPTTNTTLQTEAGTMLQLDGIDTLEYLRWQLEAYFSPTLTEHLLTNYTHFQESDGKLFVLPTNRGSNIYAGKESFQAFPLSGTEAAQHGYDCHIYSTTEVLDYDTETVLYQKRHDWYMVWNGRNHVFTSFGTYDDVDPQKYYNVLTILDHCDQGNPITDWLPLLAYLDWNAMYATRDQWPKGTDRCMDVLTTISEYAAGDQPVTDTQMQYILSATEGLDGAYSEQYQFIVYELYQKAPAAFAYTVLESLEGSYQTQIIDYLRYEEQYHRAPSANSTPMTQEEAIALLRQTMSTSLSVSPSSMYFDQPGQKEQLRLVNAYGISSASYSSSDPGVAAVDNDGFVTAVGPGEATITLHYEGAAGQKDLTCAVTCQWEEKADESGEPDASTESKLPPYADAEAINGYMRGYAPTVWEAGSPNGIETTLSDDWTMDGIRTALFQAVSAHLQGTILEKDLVRIELSPQFQFPETMMDGVVMNVPFYAHYARESITLPSGAPYTPAMRGQEATAKVTLVGSGTTAPVDDDFAKQQQDYQLLKACVPIDGGIQVSASAEEFDITTHIRNTVITALQNAGLSERYYLSSISTGSYTNPVWVSPGYEQTVFYEVTFSSADSTGIALASITGEVLVTTIE